MSSPPSQGQVPSGAGLARYGSYTLADDGCTTCGDVAVPVRIEAVAGSQAEVVDRIGNRAEVAIDFVPDASPGDVLMVHTGVAIGRASDSTASPGTSR